MRNWRSRMAAVVVVAVAVAVVVSTALAHVERASYWPDPRPDKSSSPPAGGKVPKARSLYTALNGRAVGDTRVVCQNSSISRVRQAIGKARTQGLQAAPVRAQALHHPPAGQEAPRFQQAAVRALQVPRNPGRRHRFGQQRPRGDHARALHRAQVPRPADAGSEVRGPQGGQRQAGRQRRVPDRRRLLRLPDEVPERSEPDRGDGPSARDRARTHSRRSRTVTGSPTWGRASAATSRSRDPESAPMTW